MPPGIRPCRPCRIASQVFGAKPTPEHVENETDPKTILYIRIGLGVILLAGIFFIF